MTSTFVPNADQLKAAEVFRNFLLDPSEKVMVLYGPGGTGKSATVKYLVEVVYPEYVKECRALGMKYPDYRNIVPTALTNKATVELAKATGLTTSTIHSALKLKVKDDFTTGEQTLTRLAAWQPIEESLVICDEAFMTDRKLYTEINAALLKSKILYVGDELQLEPVGETCSPISKLVPKYHARLSIPMRNYGSVALQELCQQFRQIVKTNEFTPIVEIPGHIDLLSADQVKEFIQNEFIDPSTDARILAYTNARVDRYNRMIRTIRGLPDMIQVGERLISNDIYEAGPNKLYTEQEVYITEVDPEIRRERIEGTNVVIDYYLVAVGSDKYTYFEGVRVPVNRITFRGQCQELYKAAKKGNIDWFTYFGIRKVYANLRPRDASTIHKIQGSSHDVVLVDLANIGTCSNPRTVARLLYVALTRARNRILLYGSLPDRYGGPVLR